MRKTAVVLLILLPSLAFALGGVDVLSQFGGKGEGDGMFSRETFWEIDSKGDIYVSDQELNRVQKFSPDGKLLLKIEQPIKSPKFRFRSISDISIDSPGRIYLLDWKIKPRKGKEVYDYLVCVHIFSPEGKFIRDVDLSGIGMPKYRLASAALAVLPDGESGLLIPHGDPKRELHMDVSPLGDRIYVLDGREIYLFDGNGKLLGRFGMDGLDSPVDISFDGKNIWVPDDSIHKIFKLSPDGKIELSIGGYGYGRGKFISPFWVSTLKNGSIAVLDKAALKRFAPTILKRRTGEPVKIDPDMPEELIKSTNRVEKVIFRRIQRFSRDGEFLGQTTIRLDEGDLMKGGLQPLCVGPNGEIYLQNPETLRVFRAIPAHPLSELLRRSEREVSLGLDLIRGKVEIDNPDDLDAKRDYIEQAKATRFTGGLNLRHDLDERTRAELSGFGYYIFYRYEDHYSQMDIRTRMNQDDKTLEEIGGVMGQINLDIKLSPEPYDYRTASFYAFIGRGIYNFVNDALAPSNRRYLDWNMWYTDWGGGLRYGLSKNWNFALSVLSTPAWYYDYEGDYIDEYGLLTNTFALRGRYTVVRFYLQGNL